MQPRLELWARIGITVQFLALIRSLAEVFRLRSLYGGQLEFEQAEVYIAGGLIAAVFCWLAVSLYFFRHYRWVLFTSLVSVVVLLIYKLGHNG